MILYRYIIKEHIFPFLVSLSVIVFLFVMQQAVTLLEKVISKGIDLAVVLEVFVIQMGWIIALAVPMAILTSTLITFGRMAGDNEITSIKASGQSLLTLLIPVLSASAVLAVLLVHYNNEILPDANHRTSNLLSDISRTRPAAFIEPGILIRDFTGYTIHTQEVDPISGQMKGIKIYTNASNQDPSVTVADSGTIRMTPDQQYLEVTLFDGETHSASKKNKEEYFTGKFEKQIICIKNIESGLQRTSSDYRSDREKSSAAMLADIATFKEAKAKAVSEYVASVDSIRGHILYLDSLSNGLPSIQNTVDSQTIKTWIAEVGVPNMRQSIKFRRDREIVEQTIRRIKSNDLLISQYMVEVHKKYSIPFACILFVLIGAPLGIMARKGGYAVGATYSVFFFIINWALLIAGESLADKMIISPAVAMWSGNALIAICGVVLIIMMRREITIRFDGIISFWRNAVSKEQSLMKKMSENFLFKLPKIIFWAPRWICRLFVGRLPTYLIGIFLSLSVGLMLAVIVIFVVLDYVSNLKKFQTALLSDVMLYYWHYLPWIIQIMIPVVLLLATMFSIGRMAKNNEITAMRASGINIRQLTFPLLFVGLFLSFGTFIGGEMILPHSNQVRNELSKIMRDSNRQNRSISGSREFRRDFYYFGNPQTLYYYKEFCTAPERFIDVSRDAFSGNRITQRIHAKEMLYDSTTGWSFVNAVVHNFLDSSTEILKIDTLKDTILNITPKLMVKRIKHKSEMSYWELKNHIDAARNRGEKVNQLMGELEFKIALPFMNFIVMLLGIAITAKSGRKGGAVMFGIGLVCVFAYWIISRFCLVFAQNGHLPALLGAWMGNIIFFVLGITLYAKTTR